MNINTKKGPLVSDVLRLTYMQPETMQPVSR